jgi:hypothetical protein
MDVKVNKEWPKSILDRVKIKVLFSVNNLVRQSLKFPQSRPELEILTSTKGNTCINQDLSGLVTSLLEPIDLQWGIQGTN